MTSKQITFETGASGTAIAQGSSYGGDAVDLFSKSGSGNFVLSNARNMHGSQSGRFTSTSGTDTALIRFAGFTGNDLAIRFYVWLDAYPTSTTILAGTRYSAGVINNIQVTSAGLVQFTNAVGNAYTTTTPLSLSQWNRIEQWIEVGASTSTSKMKAAVYLGDSTTSVDTVFSSTTQNLGTNAVASAQVGKTSATGSALSGYIDDFRASDTVTDLIGPEVTNAAPTANAGADQANVEPWSTVTIGGTDTDTDGTIASIAWTQTSGPTTALSSTTAASPTFTAPGTLAGTTLVYRKTVTDNLGATAFDDVTVTVLPASERINIGGSYAPCRWHVV